MTPDEKKASQMVDIHNELFEKLQKRYPNPSERAQAMAVISVALAGVSLTYAASCGSTMRESWLMEFESCLNSSIPIVVELREKVNTVQ